MRYRFTYALALVTYQASRVSAANYYSNASQPVSAWSLSSTPTSTSTLYTTSTEVVTKTLSSSLTSGSPVPTSSYISLVTTELHSYDNPSNRSSTLRPAALGWSYYWNQAITPTILGTVYVVVNNLNQTKTYTSTDSAALASNTMFLQNGTLELLTRSDTNDEGTVTAVVPTAIDGTTVLAYPTPLFAIPGPISWFGQVPITLDGGLCCDDFLTSSAVPRNHYPFPSMTGSTNSRDPSGWLYSLVSHPTNYAGSAALSSILAPATINSILNYCPYAGCNLTSTEVAASAVEAAAQLLTTTVHVTVSSSSTTNAVTTPLAAPPAAPASTTPASTVAVDPVTAGVPISSGTPPAASKSPESDTSTQQSEASRSPTPSAEAENTSPTLAAQPENTGPTQQGNGASPAVASSNLPNPETASAQTQDSDGTVPATTPVQTTQDPSGPSSLSSDIVAPAPSPVSSDDSAAGLVASILGAHATVTVTSGQQPVASPDSLTNAPQFADSSAPSAVFGFTDDSATTAPPRSTDQAATPAQPHSTNQPAAGSEISQIAPVPVGSSTVAISPVDLLTTVSGTSSILPGVVIGSQTVYLGSTVAVDSTPVAVITSNSHTYVVIGDSTSPIQQTAASPSTADQPPPLVIGTNTISANAQSQYVVSDQTLAPGSSITVGSGSSTTVVALQTTASQKLLVVGSSTALLHPDSAQTPQQAEIPSNVAPASITVGSAVLTPDASSGYAYRSATLSPGGSITLGSGASTTVVALQTSGSQTVLVVGSSTSKIAGALVPQATAAPITIGSSIITPNSASEYVVGSQTLSPGVSALTISGTEYSLASGATAIVIGSSTQILTGGGQRIETPAPITVGSAIITPNSASEYIVGSQTLSPGGSALTISGTRYSLASGATAIIIGSSTQALTGGAHPIETPAPITVGTAIITPNSASEYIIGSQTLSPGGPALSISGTRYSLASGATEIVIGSSTEILTQAGAGSTAQATKKPVPITVGTAIITPNSASEYIIASQTLSPGGPALTVSGTRYSLASGASELVVGSSTETLVTSEAGVASYIWSGLGGAAATGTSTGSDGSSNSNGLTSQAGSATSSESVGGTAAATTTMTTTTRSDATAYGMSSARWGVMHLFVTLTMVIVMG